MPGSTPNALRPIRHQLRRARRRWNARQLARAALLSAATTASVAAALVLASLAASPGAFAVVALGLAAALLVAVAAITAHVRRGWIPARVAHRRVDRHARLGGRLAALCDAAATRSATTALGPLLLAQNLAMLPLWRPRRLVPRLATPGATAAAVAGVAALALALRLGPVVFPPPPPTDVASQMRPTASPARGMPRVRAPGPEAAPADGEAAPADDAGTLAAAAEAVQHALHRRLWGEEEAIRVREAARAAETPAADRPRNRLARGERGGRIEPGEPAAEGRSAPGTTPGEGSPAAGDPTAAGEAGASGRTADGPASGAGSGTSPDLYGRPSVLTHRGAAPFALGLTARVRVAPAAPRPPTGEAPRQLPDAGPALAPEGDPAIGAPRAPVPAEYAGVVRRLFERAP